MLKRSFVLLTVLVLLVCNTAFAAGNTIFNAKSITAKYNDSIVPFFTALTGKSASAFTMVKIQMQIDYKEQSNGATVYTNYDSTVKVTFYTDPYSGKVNKITFWTSLEDSSEWKNIPQMIFAFAVCLAGDAEYAFLEWVNDGADGSTFSNANFSAVKKTENLKASWITITAK